MSYIQTLNRPNGTLGKWSIPKLKNVISISYMLFLLV